MTRRDWIKEQLGLDLDEMIVVDLWSEHDIREIGDELDVDLADSQVEEILDLMGVDVDSNVGMNWTLVENCIQTVLDSDLKD